MLAALLANLPEEQHPTGGGGFLRPDPGTGFPEHIVDKDKIKLDDNGNFVSYGEEEKSGVKSTPILTHNPESKLPKKRRKMRVLLPPAKVAELAAKYRDDEEALALILIMAEAVE